MFPSTHACSGTLADDALARQRAVELALGRAGYPELQQVEVCEVDGRIELTGTVRSYYLKQMAQTAALQVPGVEEVRNEIVVM